MKQVLLTGGGGGIGRAVAQKLAKNGYRVFSADITPAEAEENILPIVMDVRNVESVQAACAAVSAQTERLDAVLHFAGVIAMDSLLEMSESAFLRVFDVNLNGVYRVNHVFFPLLRQPGGRIVITTSELAPLTPLPFNGIYAIAKAALDKYAESLRLEAALLGVDVITVRPGAVKTSLLSTSDAAMRRMVAQTKLYQGIAGRFERIVEMESGTAIPPQRFAALIERAMAAKRPRPVYRINNSALLRLFSALPARVQRRLLCWLLVPKQRRKPE